MLVTVDSIRENEINRINENIIDVIFQDLGFPTHTRFAYAVMNKQQAEPPVIFSNYPPEWVDKYINMTLYKYDPVILLARKSIMPFIWSDKTLPFGKSGYEKIFEAARPFNILSGYAFPLHDHENNLATLSLYADIDCGLKFKECIEKHKKSIQLLLLSIHEQYMLTRSRDCSKQEHARALTVRETEVLRWASYGKTYSEIGIIMGIAESTVKFHISNLIEKLGVVNAKHAIKKAADLQLFNVY